jgi:hypothetical protein
MTRITRFLLGTALAAMAGSPASAATIQLRGTVQTICEMSEEVASTSATTSVAGLTIFCNAADGAHISMSLIDGDASGYRISGSGGSFVAKPGGAFDLKTFNTAFAGFEQLEIAQLGGAAPISPVIMFEIVASD